MKEKYVMAEAMLSQYHENTFNLVNKFKQYINDNDCPDLSMDISHLNVLEASKVAILCSTFHWAKYPEGKLNCIINSEEVNDIVKPLDLGNIRLITPQ